MSLIEAFERTYTVRWMEKDYTFQRITLAMAAKFAAKVKAARVAEAERQYREASRERIAAAQASGQATPSFWASEQANRAGMTAVKVGMRDVYAMLDDFDGVAEILRFAGEEAGQAKEDVEAFVGSVPIQDLTGIAMELFASPLGEKKANPPQGDGTKTTGENSPPSTSPSTDTNPTTSPSDCSSTESEKSFPS